jgi:crossover junction endodeoxyribonuclease RuvC
MTNLVAIDPGLKGAIAVLSDGGISVHRMPIAGKDLDLPTIAAIIKAASPEWIILEKVGAMPGQGVASTFKFGKGYGMIQGIAAAMEVALELTTPQRWKKVVLHGTTKDKAAAIAFCRRAFPTIPLVPKGCRVPHDGIADALCLLEYGRRTLTQEAA